ncbi:MAG TPA: TlpA disulfide reductase family protein [Povalibacter sp.]|nr:TlpA disulfide reductase family protein [Povalibacter sp.]
MNKMSLPLLMLLSIPLIAAADGSAPRTQDAAAVLATRLFDLEEQPHQLAEWNGQPVLVNYWATWCAPCLKEIPELEAFSVAQQKRKGGIRVVGVALDEPDAVRSFVKRGRVSYTVLVEHAEPDASTSVALGNKHGALPFSVLLDAQGRVLGSKSGAVTAADLAAWASIKP